MKKLGFIVEMKDCKDAADLRRWVDLAQQQGIDGVELLFKLKVRRGLHAGQNQACV